MKKSLLIGASLSLVGAVSLGAVVGCSCNKGNTAKVDVNAKDVYAISALSSANYLSSGEMENTGLGISNEHAGIITDSIKIFDNILANGKVSQEVIKNDATNNQEFDEKYAQYNFLMKVSMPGNKDLLKMYYDEVKTETEEEIEDEEVEVETSTTLEGVILMNGKEFKMEGKREFEIEGDETEATIEFTATRGNRKLVVEQSVENDEIEYEYRLYRNDVLLKSIELEIENEKDGVSLELELGNAKNMATCKISKKDDTSFMVEYTLNKHLIKASAIKGEDGNYTLLIEAK